MTDRRKRLAVCGGLVLAWGVAWLAARTPAVNPPVRNLVPGKPYAVDVRWNESTLDLEFGAGARYVLIVSSLGDAGQKYTVSLDAEPLAEAASLPVRPLDPLRVRRIRTNFSSSRDAKGAKAQRGKGAKTQRGKGTEGQRHKGAQAQRGKGRTATRDFHLHVTDGQLDDPKHYVRVSSRVVAEGKRVRVYLDRRQGLSELASGVTDEIVQLLDDEIIPRLEQTLGTTRDVDGDGKFSVLLTPWLSCLQGGKTSLGGFVRGTDFRSDVEPPFSNRCDMLYLNSNVRMGPHLRTLLAHELTHAICFSARLPSERNRLALPDEEDWLNEAIAHLAENLSEGTWSNLHYRLSRYLNAPQEYPLVVGDYHRAGWWRNHGCRGATYLFLRWCVDQYGEGLLPRLIRSPSRGTRNLERATGERFEELYRRWTVAVLQSGQQSPRASGTNVRPQATGFRRQAFDAGSREPAARLAVGCYTSLDLRAPLAGWGLAGPRMEAWDVDSGGRNIELRGTATAFLDVESTGTPGARRIRIQGDYGVNLQISIVKRPDDWPRVWIETEWMRTTPLDSGPTAVDETWHVVCARIHAAGAGGLHVETIACERNDGETKQSFCFTGKSLRRAQRPSTTDGNTDLGSDYHLSFPAPRGPAVSTAVLVKPAILVKPAMLVKVVVSDRAGRRASAWATIDAIDPTVFELQVADAASDLWKRGDNRLENLPGSAIPRRSHQPVSHARQTSF